MKIECFMLENCGSYHQLRKSIDRALAELNMTADVSYTAVSYEEAVSRGMKGSPTIRINGKDIDDGGSPGIT